MSSRLSQQRSLNQSQKKGRASFSPFFSPPSPTPADKNSWSEAEAGTLSQDHRTWDREEGLEVEEVAEEEVDGQKKSRKRVGSRRRRSRTHPSQVWDFVHLYGLCPELRLVRGGRGAAGVGGQNIICEEEESGEE